MKDDIQALVINPTLFLVTLSIPITVPIHAVIRNLLIPYLYPIPAPPIRFVPNKEE
jgi:hypothetical protein